MVETCYTVPSCPVSIALVTDTHNRPADGVLESLGRRKPALILLAGDFVYADPPTIPGRLKIQDSRDALALLQGCAAVAPTLISLGNHEWMLNETDLALLHSYGITVLDNRFAAVSAGGTEVCCGGLSSARFTAYQTWRRKQAVPFLYPEPDRTVWAGKPEPCTDWLDDFERQPGYKILLCHHPEYAPRYLKGRRIDLILSGHAHGGQWRYYSPLDKRFHGVYAPGQGLFPKLTEGRHGNQIISRGRSNNSLIPRLWNPPELVYINRSGVAEGST